MNEHSKKMLKQSLVIDNIITWWWSIPKQLFTCGAGRGGVGWGVVEWGFPVVGWGWLEIYMFPLCKPTCMGVRYVANRSFDSMEFWILCGLQTDGVNSFKIRRVHEVLQNVRALLQSLVYSYINCVHFYKQCVHYFTHFNMVILERFGRIW